MKTRFVWGLAVIGLAAVVLAKDASAKEVEWASLTLGYMKDGKAQGGVCTDKKTQADAEVCSLKAFKDAGGIKITTTRAWRCKGFIAAAIASNGAAGVAWCKASAKEAEVEALATCMKSAPGPDNCKIMFKKSDLL